MGHVSESQITLYRAIWEILLEYHSLVKKKKQPILVTLDARTRVSSCLVVTPAQLFTEVPREV